MRFCFYLPACLLCGMCLGAQTRETPSAKVEVQVLTFVGEHLEDAVVTLVQKATNKALGQLLTVKDARHITSLVPYGEYELHVRRPGFRSHKQSLPIYQPRLSLRVFLRVAQITDEAPTEVVGTVTAVPASAKLWIKMFPLLTGEFIGEAEVESDGRFRLTGLDAGEYLLVVMNGTECIYTKQLRLYGIVKATIVLPSTRVSK
jgi:hypothetical protein